MTDISAAANISNTPSLTDLSQSDKPWDKHRSNADKVSTYYAGSEFQDYSARINDCSELLDFRLVPDADEGLMKLKLSSARFCRVRHCPVCQWRRSLMWCDLGLRWICRLVVRLG